MYFFANLYYVFWAQIRTLPRVARIAIVLNGALIIVWIAMTVLLPKIMRLLLWLFNKYNKHSYIIISDYLLPHITRKNYLSVANKFSQYKMRVWEQTEKTRTKLKKRKRHIGKFIFIYGVVFLLLICPEWIRPYVSSDYMKYFSFASDAYDNFEANQISLSETYMPVILTEENRIEGETQETFKKARIKEDVNLRSGPSTTYSVKKVLHKHQTISIMDFSENKNWYYVKTEDGLEGWVYQSFVEDTIE